MGNIQPSISGKAGPFVIGLLRGTASIPPGPALASPSEHVQLRHVREEDLVLAAQRRFALDDVLDPIAPHPHASSNAIDSLIAAADSHLAAIARLAGNRTNFNDALGDFGDFLFEQPLDKLSPRAAENDLHPTAALADFAHSGTHAFVGVMGFAGDLFAARQDGFGIRQRDGGRAAGQGNDDRRLDGEQWPPSLHGTGTEDYFNTAYCPADKYDAPYHGMTLPGGPNWSGKSSYYRFHIEDAIHFRKSIKVTIEHGHANHRADDISSTAYWYQLEPHKPFPPLPPVAERLPRPD